MRTKNLTLGLAVILASCVLPQRPVPVENDRSIVFPRFFEHSAVEVGAGGAAYELDGVVLRAVMRAANDFLPPGNGKRPCVKTQEAHRYRVIRQGNIIFVRIDENLEFCGLQYVALDTGVTYAISAEGRILRRVFDGQPDQPLYAETPDAGGQGCPTSGGEFPAVDAGQRIPSRSLVPEEQDGGTPSSGLMPTPFKV
ncbi:hypothetical protein [Archangium sp.]|uniref:hypothetical protein n=1 Tax=Archangium sp. TaxID=1872627 RepID=UPI002EDA4B7A